MAFCTNWKELMFFISVRVPNTAAPTGRTDRLTSHRMPPSFILHWAIPVYTMAARSFLR